MKTKARPKARIQLVISEGVNQLIDELAEKQRRARSAIVELAILRYATRSAAGRFLHARNNASSRIGFVIRLHATPAWRLQRFC